MSSRSRTLGLALLAGWICLAEPRAEASFTGFGTGAGFTLNGDATGTPTISNGVATLTNGFGSESRSVFFNTAQSITRFTAQFTYQDVGAKGADGFAFVIQNSAAGATATGLGGDGLGYGGLTQSVGVLFSLLNPSTGTGLGTNGAIPRTDPTIPFGPTGNVTIPSGNLIRINLGYDGTTLTETLTDLLTSATFTTSYQVNLASVIESSTGFVGFTGGTGAGVSTQQVRDLTFNNSVVPEPTSFTLLTLGAIGVGPLVRVRPRRQR